MRRNRGQRLRGNVTLLVALPASVGLHLVAVALLVPERAVPPPPGRTVRMDVELRSAPAPAPPPPRAKPGRRRSDPRGGRTVIAPAPPPSERTTPPDGRPPGPPESLGGPEVHGAPDLRVRWPTGALAEEGAARLSPPRERDATGGWLREQAGRARVESGVVHPYYRERALVRAWDAERVIENRGLSGYLAQAGDNVRAFGRVWRRVADGFATTGSPGLIDGGSARMKELSGLPAGPARDALVSTEVQRQLRPAFSKGHVTIVRVTQDAEGRLLSVELLSPSQDAEIDRAAIEDVRAAARLLPAPPEGARLGRDRLVSTWELELEISISPPLPTVAVEFDEVLGLRDVRVPLDRRVWKRVRLVAVD